VRLDDPWLRLELPDGELFFRELGCLAEWVQEQMLGAGEPDGASID
jgi:hypothetical protein